MNERIKSMQGESFNLHQQDIDRLKKIFPEILTDGEKIDFDKLKDLLAEEVDDSPERYNFTWNGKRQAIKQANTPTTGTLLPNKEKSKDWDTTQNLYIEGDNLEVLKLLQKSYAGKVKVIYIDPPYNTGHDFVYKDDFKDSVDNYLEQTGQVDEEGNKLSTNSESNGRFHTDWLNMMYPRLRLAKNLLKDNGVIFMSIDDNEAVNLKKIADEIFGENNFLAQVVWERAYAPINLKKNFSTSHDYILVYGKDTSIIEGNGMTRSLEADSRYGNPDNDYRGDWKPSDLSVGPAVESNIYPITTPSGRVVEPPAGRSWRLSPKAFRERLQDNRIWFGKNGDAVPSMKRFKSELRKQGITPMTIWKYEEVDHSQGATQKLQKLLGNKKYFNYPKPVKLIQRTIQLYSDPDSIILDFFSGSATTAHAVMQQNADDGGSRKFIMVQLPEQTEENSTAYRDGYTTIPEIAEERIRRAGKKILNENPDLKIDTGFKVFELAKTNIRQWDSNPEKLEEQLDAYEATEGNNFVSGRTSEDVVYELLLKQGLELTDPIEKKTINKTDIYIIDHGALYVVIGTNFNHQVADFITSNNSSFDKGLITVIFQDVGFESDSDKLNVLETLKNSGYKEENIFTV
jgi:adenine-specific DNA-methyltransferase